MSKLKCTGMIPLPVAQVLFGMQLVGAPIECLAVFPEGFALCELGAHEDEDSDHAVFVWETTNIDQGLWFWWNDTESKLAIAPWCGQSSASGVSGSACHLFAQHPSAHSWDVHDPTHEALKADLFANPEKYGFPPLEPS